MTRSACWIAALLFAALVLAKFNPQTGFTSLIRFGETWQDRRHSSLQGLSIETVPASPGYDGQFYAQIALDPLLRGAETERLLDVPAYRARRILAPATAAVLGCGNSWWTLQVYALLNVACWFALGWILFTSIDPRNLAGFARWVGCMFSMGVLDSVRQSLVDLPALLLLTLAIRSSAQAHAGKSALWLSLGNLAKETNLLGTLALTGEGLTQAGRRRNTVLMILAAVLPLGLWSLYVRQRFSTATASEGLGNFTWPFFGLCMQAKIGFGELLRGNYDSRYTFGLLAIIGLLTQTVVLWRTPKLQSPWWRVGVAYSLLLPFLSLWVWMGYWGACRAVLPLTIAFNLLLPANRAFWPLWTIGNLTLLHAVWRFL